ncbi:lactoylglutathione lyase [Pseudomonas sp. OIL-1]|uniref:lactoylglutathione lyase n=1 Tax=Pseudomonas sp. OIL-1 TaxID=2706126 RepID=UPI0013A71D63|nr:lactoylglutathione lyase [Pseudomonas sp. OIL-1]QIB50185.1 lactoylglutathione lyase [Pseudomonas sp. OIL-1]
MSRHFETAEGLCEDRDPATEGFVLNQTMLRVKDPTASLDFYTRIMGMTLVKRLDFEDMRFSLYFLAMIDELDLGYWSHESRVRLVQTFGRPAMLELTHNWGTEDDPEFAYHNGNDQPQGFGHIGFAVPDLDAACERFESMGVEFVKRPNDGKMKRIAFIKDPDGYWIELFTPGQLPDVLG